MADALAVKLRADYVPQFPPACIACGAPRPESTFALRVSTYNVLKWVFWWWPAKRRVRVDVPACWPCAQRLRHERFWREAGQWAILILVVVAVMQLSPAAWRPYRKLIALGAAFVAMLPYIVFEVVRPRTIDLTAHKDAIAYEFRDHEYAKRFIMLNLDGVVTS